jgi:hypothetical protein
MLGGGKMEGRGLFLDPKQPVGPMSGLTSDGGENRRRMKQRCEQGKIAGLSIPVSPGFPQGWAVRTPYDPALTELLRCLPGARWNADLKRWTVPLRATEALRAVLPRLTELAAEVEPRAGARAHQTHRARSPLIP